MVYLQMYLVVGIVYTIFNFGKMFNYLRKDLIKQYPVIYSENKEAADNLIRAFCLLLVFIWPLALFKLIRNLIFG